MAAKKPTTVPPIDKLPQGPARWESETLKRAKKNDSKESTPMQVPPGKATTPKKGS